jgi:hypothetical protein
MVSVKLCSILMSTIATNFPKSSLAVRTAITNFTRRITSEKIHLDHQYFLTIAFVLNQILEYVADQLAEWQHEHVGVENMMKSSVGEYQRLKPMLLTHLATTARESVIFSNGEPGSASDHINVRDRAVNVSERQRQRFQRKRLRKWANMEPSERAEFENNPNMGWF